MAKLRLQKSLADYVAIAMCPVLIMLLVGSLVYFLLAVFCTDMFEGRIRMHWIMFWFVFASVLIARIAIEQGSEYAGVYGLLLAAATSLVIFRYVDSPVIALILLAVIWWCTNKLTWDSTLIDDSEDASGEGLLQASGLQKSMAEDIDGGPSQPPAVTTSTDDGPAAERSASWKHLVGMHVKQEGQPHAPGMWVVYFSLAALPLFGIGQLGLDQDARPYGFRLLWIYVASALGLLLLTSFLGLRRYLRQRRLKMPMGMAGTWIGMGAVLILAILFLCILIPRPENEHSINTWIDRIGSLAQQASNYALVDEDAGQGEGQRSGKGDPQDAENDDKGDRARPPTGENQGKSQDSRKENLDTKNSQEQSAGDSKDGGKRKSQAGKNQQSESGKPDDSERGKKNGTGKNKKKDGSGKGAKPSSPKEARKQNARSKRQEVADKNQAKKKRPQLRVSAPKLSSFPEWIAQLVKWTIWGLILLAFLCFVIRHWSQWAEAWQRLWNRLFGREAETASESGTDKSPPPRPFAEFRNPFWTGEAQRMSPAELVRYSFDGLKAWSVEQGHLERLEQTPLEFGQELSERFSKMAREIQHLAELYSRTAYANHSPSRDSLKPLQQLWRKMDNVGQTDVVQDSQTAS